MSEIGVSLVRGTKEEIASTSIVDGQLLFTTDQVNNNVYADVGDKRVIIGGGGSEPDNTLSLTSTNTVQNKVVTTALNEQNKKINATNENLDSLNETLAENSTYSTEEKVVGTWIDGKPIYRRIIKNNSCNISTDAIIDSELTTNYVDSFIKSYGDIVMASGEKWSISSYFHSIVLKANGAYLMFQQSVSGASIIQSYEIIVEYTKATD